MNHDRREYIDLGAYVRDSGVTKDGETWCINPLPLLTACGNGRGGGDFSEGHTGYEHIGLWAFEVVEYITVVPNGYVEHSFKFIED